MYVLWRERLVRAERRVVGVESGADGDGDESSGDGDEEVDAVGVSGGKDGEADGDEEDVDAKFGGGKVSVRCVIVAGVPGGRHCATLTSNGCIHTPPLHGILMPEVSTHVAWYV